MTLDLDGRLCKAGRALLGWNQADLATAANVAKQTVADFERGARQPFPNNRRAIAEALMQAGVGFVREGERMVGVRRNGSPSGGSPSGDAPPDGRALVARALRQP